MTHSAGEILRVIPDDLRRFGDALGSGADEAGALTPAGPFRAAAEALADTETASILGRAPARVGAVFDAVADRLAELGRVAHRNADAYERADGWAPIWPGMRGGGGS